MPFKFNALTGNLDLVNATQDLSSYMQVFVQVGTPSSPIDGKTIWINTVTSEMRLWYGGAWQLLHTLTPATLSYLLLEDGSSILLEDGFKLALEN